MSDENRTYTAREGSIHPKVLDGLRQLGMDITVEHRTHFKRTDLLPMDESFLPSIEEEVARMKADEVSE